jgi:hypothetical protein
VFNNDIGSKVVRFGLAVERLFNSRVSEEHQSSWLEVEVEQRSLQSNIVLVVVL